MTRSFRFSAVLFAAVLSPALFQASITCHVDTPELVILELHARGIDRVVDFTGSRFVYDVSMDGATEMTIRASSKDRDQPVRWTYGDGSGTLGRGGGEVTLPVRPELPSVIVHVGPVGTTGRSYTLHIDPRARRWSVPERIGGNTLNVRYPQIEFDADGNAFVIWREDDGVSFNIGVNRFTPAEGWTGPERISIDDGAEDFEEPHLAIDPSGNAIAVWRQHHHVVYSRYTRAEGWTAPARIDTGVPFIETRTNGQPQVAVYPGGEAMAVWRVVDSPTDDSIWASRFTPDEGWSLPERIEIYAGDASTPRVAPTPDGGALAVWQDGYDSFASIVSAQFTLADGWGNRGLVGRGRWAFPPRLLYNEAGDIMHVFLGDGSFGEQKTRRWDPESGWAPETFEPGPEGGYVSAGMDADGAVLIAWHDIVAPSTLGALAIRSVLGEGFGEPVEIGDPVLGGAYSPDIAVHPDGHAIAVFRQPEGDGQNVWFNRFTPALGWETPAPVAQRDNDVAATPRVAIDSYGNAIAVWEEADASGNTSLWASRLAVPFGPDAREDPFVIDDDDVRSFDPHVAVNDRGLALVVWDSEEGMTARFRYGAGDWGYARIIQDDTGNAWSPIPKLDDDDRTTIIWQQAPHAGAYYTRHSPELDWEPPAPIDSVDSSFEHLGALDVAPIGNGVALWTSDGVIEGATFAPGQDWSLPLKVSNDSRYDAFNESVFLGPNGDGFTTWTIVASSLWARRYVPGAGFEDPELLTDTVVGNDGAQIAVAPDGSAIAVWHRYWGGHGDIWHSHYEVGGGWSTPEQLDQTDDPLLFDARIGMDAEGNAIVVWRQSPDEFFDIWSRVYSPETGWGDAELIELATGQSETPTLAVSASGHAVVVWGLGREAQPGPDLNIWANRYTPGQGWGVSQRIEYNFRFLAWDPDVAIAGDGTAVVTWGDGQDIWCRVLEP